MFNNYRVDSWQKAVLYIVTILTIGLIYLLGKKKVKFSYRVLLAMFVGVVVGLTLGQTKTDITGLNDKITITYVI